MAEKLVCPICGAPTRVYMGNTRKDGLCAKHADELKAGKLLKCDKCGEWHYIDEPCKCFKGKYNKDIVSVERQRQNDCKCVVCGEEAPKGSLCKECYYEMLDFKDSFDKNSKSFELKDYYFNLRSNIYRMKNFDYIKSNCNKLMALAVLVKNLFDDEALTDRAVNDIKEIIEKKKPKDVEKVEDSDDTKAGDAHKEEIHRTFDGHYVKSQQEAIIDDILYDARIVHCYEKKVPINSDEPTVLSDWFIPILDNRQGIYIEYWGKKTQDYLKNKERKRKAYKEHDIPLIEIEKDDTKDKHGLTDRLISEINALAEKYFRIKDFIK